MTNTEEPERPNDTPDGQLDRHSFGAPWQIGSLMVVAAGLYPFTLANGDRDALVGMFWLVGAAHAIFIVMVPFFVGARRPPAPDPLVRSLVVMLAGLAPWLLLLMTWPALKTTARLMAYFPVVLIWDTAAFYIGWWQRPGPAGWLTRSYLLASGVIVIGALAIEFLGALLR